jgi:hypothetical protein
MYVRSLIILIPAICIFCNRPQANHPEEVKSKERDTAVIINLPQTGEKQLNASEFADTVLFVPMETNPQSHISSIKDLSDVLKSTNEIESSKIVSGFEYIKLSSKRNHMIVGSPRFFVKDSIIICIAFKQIFLFDRKTGEFLKEIGENGRGPKAYWATRLAGSVDFISQIQEQCRLPGHGTISMIPLLMI